MHDQANTLRKLAQHAANSPAHGVCPAIVVVTGGKGGVGTTTVAVNLAAAAAQAGTRTVLIDADLHGGDAAMLCGLPERTTLADVLAGRCTMAEAIQPGPCRLQVLTGVCGYEQPLDDPDDVGRRLLDQLATIAPQTDLAVFDTGNGCNQMLLRLARAAKAVLTVTTAQTPSVLGGYASIKALLRRGAAGPFHVLVNRVDSPAAGRQVHARLGEAGRRCLAVKLHRAGVLPNDRSVAVAAESYQPLPMVPPKSPVARQLTQLAVSLTAGLIPASPIPARSPNKPSVSATVPRPQYAKPRKSAKLEKTAKTL